MKFSLITKRLLMSFLAVSTVYKCWLGGHSLTLSILGGFRFPLVFVLNISKRPQDNEMKFCYFNLLFGLFGLGEGSKMAPLRVC